MRTPQACPLRTRATAHPAPPAARLLPSLHTSDQRSTVTRPALDDTLLGNARAASGAVTHVPMPRHLKSRPVVNVPSVRTLRAQPSCSATVRPRTEQTTRHHLAALPNSRSRVGGLLLRRLCDACTCRDAGARCRRAAGHRASLAAAHAPVCVCGGLSAPLGAPRRHRCTVYWCVAGVLLVQALLRRCERRHRAGQG